MNLSGLFQHLMSPQDAAGQSNQVVDGALVTQEGGYGLLLHEDGIRKPILRIHEDERDQTCFHSKQQS